MHMSARTIIPTSDDCMESGPVLAIRVLHLRQTSNRSYVGGVDVEPF